MIDKLGAALDFNSQALRLRARRQEVLASNIANADTPNYKAQDFDFASALKAATASASVGSAPGQLVTTNPAHLPPVGAGNPTAAAQYRQAVQPSIDGNTVDMDTERAQFADNAIRYEAAMRFLNGQIRTILSAIQGQ